LQNANCRIQIAEISDSVILQSAFSNQQLIR
jgi:hypothetical protein